MGLCEEELVGLLDKSRALPDMKGRAHLIKQIRLSIAHMIQYKESDSVGRLLVRERQKEYDELLTLSKEV